VTCFAYCRSKPLGLRCRSRNASAISHHNVYARLRISCRLCISAAVCSMRNNGTRNAGISSSGSVAIGAVLISPGAPVAKKGTHGSDADGDDEVQYPEDIPTDECATGGEARLTHQGKNHPRGRDPDGHVSEASRQGEHSREHVVRIEGEEAQTGPTPGLHSRNEPKIQREHELAEGLREPQRREKEHQGRCNSNRNGQGRCPGRATNAPAAPSDTTSKSQTVSAIATARRIPPRPCRAETRQAGEELSRHDALL
jgi:hypothetical protein